jgi:Uma2 family endonuclease
VTFVSVVLAEHTEPWTPDDVEALPDSGDHARFEVFEGGVLVVSPAPGVAHQRASYWLHQTLAEAAARTSAETEVLEAVNIAMPGNKLLVPDLVVVSADAIDETTTRIPVDAVLAVVEVVSPSTISINRPIKPAMYAEAAIPVYWRIELQDAPRIVVSTLTRGRYVTRSTVTAGTRGRITKPFPVEIDPAALIHRIG